MAELFALMAYVLAITMYYRSVRDEEHGALRVLTFWAALPVSLFIRLIPPHDDPNRRRLKRHEKRADADVTRELFREIQEDRRRRELEAPDDDTSSPV